MATSPPDHPSAPPRITRDTIMSIVLGVVCLLVVYALLSSHVPPHHALAVALRPTRLAREQRAARYPLRPWRRTCGPQHPPRAIRPDGLGRVPLALQREHVVRPGSVASGTVEPARGV